MVPLNGLATEGDEMFLVHDLLDPVHDLVVQIQVDLDSLALDDLLNPAFPGKPLVPVGIGPHHFDQLMRGDEVVKYDDVLRQHRNLFLGDVHGADDRFQHFEEMFDHQIGGFRSQFVFLVPILLEFNFIAVVVLMRNLHQLIEIRGGFVLVVVLAVDVVLFVEVVQFVYFVADYA